ncbi:N-methyl-L-tryptophan oxidase [Kribbella jejuensis]
MVGLGAFGSAALWRLAARGLDAVGIERQGIGHAFGSSHGATRLFRVACMEHPGLTAIARKSLALWTELGEWTGETYVRQTGSLNVGAPESRPVKGVRAAAAAAGAVTTELTHDELHEQFPQYNLAPEDVAIWDPDAGICYAEPTVRAHVAAAVRLGATVYPHTMVTGIEVRPDGVRVRTPTTTITADQVVIATGAWLSKLVPGPALSPRRTPLFWFQPKDPASDAFRLRNFPSFIWEFADGRGLWGHGSDEDFGVKVGLDGAERDRDIDPDELDRYIHPRKDIAELSAAIADHFPDLDPEPVKLMPCMVTDSLDGQFLVGRYGDRVLIAGGDSGHGFKHCAGIGELLAQQTTKETPYTDVSFLDPHRFQR